METKTFVFVHGAWQDASVWSAVSSQLEAKGHTTHAVNLPAHGKDETPLSEISLEKYREVVVQAIESQSEKVILVGHSMAGMVISAVAEAIPNKIEKLVYLAAYLPQDGDSLMELSQKDTDSITGANFEPAPDWSYAGIKKEMIGEIFLTDGTAEMRQMLVDTHRVEPLAPFQAKVTLSEGNFGSIPKYYIETLQDKAVSNQLQKLMIAANGKVVKSYSINAGHSPFLSKPDEVVKLLSEIIEL